MRGLALKTFHKTLTAGFTHTLYSLWIVLQLLCSSNIYESFESNLFYSSGQIVKLKFWFIRTIHRKHKYKLKWKGQLLVKSLHDGKVTSSIGESWELSFLSHVILNINPFTMFLNIFVFKGSTNVSKRAKLRKMVPSFMSSPAFQPVASTLWVDNAITDSHSAPPPHTHTHTVMQKVENAGEWIVHPSQQTTRAT